MIIALASLASAAPPGSEVVAGWNGNRTIGYGFLALQPALLRSSDASLVARVTLSDEYYYFVDPTGLNRVQSPGVAIGPGFLYEPRNFAVGFAVGIEARQETTRIDGSDRVTTDALFDATFAGNIGWRPRQRADLYGSFSFSSATAYLWAQVGATVTVLPLHKLDPPVSLLAGVEGSTSGNKFSRIWAVGPVLELPIASIRSAISVRGGVSFLEPAGLPTTTSLTLGVGVYWSY